MKGRIYTEKKYWLSIQYYFWSLVWLYWLLRVFWYKNNQIRKISGLFQKSLHERFRHIEVMVWNSNENWRPKSVFLAFTTTKDCEGKVIIKTSIDKYGWPTSYLDFQFGKNEKDFMEFRKQIGLVSIILMIHWYYVIKCLVE